MMKITAVVILGLFSLCLTGCHSWAERFGASHSESEGEAESHEHQIVVTSPVRTDVVSTQPYVCQIHSCQHIEVRALEGGYLEKISVKEGQAVKKGELMFKILPVLYQARQDSEEAEVQRTQIELDNAEALLKKGFVSAPEIALKKAELTKAKAKLAVARAELSFTSITAPFDGIVDRQRNQLGSLIEEGDMLTTFSDNSTMWVYFNVPEARYLEYKVEFDKQNANQVAFNKSKSDEDGADADEEDSDDIDAGRTSGTGGTDHLQIELKLANGKIFPHKGKIGAIEADFNNTTGNIMFRADFPNPDGLLRNGQTGTILIHRQLQGVIVIPQRAKFDVLARQYVYVVDEEGVVHQRDIKIQSVQDDIFVIEDGLDEKDKIVLEGIRQIRDGDKKEYEYRAPKDILSKLKYPAE